MKIILRAEARALGIKRYFTGTPCKHGHLSDRLASNGSCLECFAIRQRGLYHANVEEERRKQKIRRDTDINHNAKKRARRIAREPEYEARSDAWKLANEARKAAAVRGDSQYTTGRPCSKGHLSPRFTNGGKCVECSRISCAERYEVRAQRNPSIMEFRRTAAERVKVVRQKREAYARKVGPWRKTHEARQTALKNGDLTYVGRPCPQGHDGTKYTKSGGCVQCHAATSASAEKKAYDRLYFAANFDRIRRRSKLYHAKTADQRAITAKRWAAANREKVRVIKDAYKSRRRAKELGGDPTAVIHAWKVSAIKKCYWCGVWCKKRYHVDHYVPLSKGWQA